MILRVYSATPTTLIRVEAAAGAVRSINRDDVFGKNPLFVFALSAFLPETLGLIRFSDGENPWSVLYGRVYSTIPGDPRIGSLAYALTVIAFMWFVCYVLDKKKIYIKV